MMRFDNDIQGVTRFIMIFFFQSLATLAEGIKIKIKADDEFINDDDIQLRKTWSMLNKFLSE